MRYPEGQTEQLPRLGSRVNLILECMQISLLTGSILAKFRAFFTVFP